MEPGRREIGKDGRQRLKGRHGIVQRCLLSGTGQTGHGCLFGVWVWDVGGVKCSLEAELCRLKGKGLLKPLTQVKIGRGVGKVLPWAGGSARCGPAAQPAAGAAQ